MDKILSLAAKSPSSSPRSSVFNLLTFLSNQIFLAESVDTPSDLSSIFLTVFFVKILPTEALPLIAKSAKS